MSSQPPTPTPARRRMYWSYGAAALLLAGLCYGVGRGLSQGPRPAVGTPPTAPSVSADLLTSTAAAEAAAPQPEAPMVEPASVVLAQRKRIMGRVRSLEMVRRTATTIRPLVDQALSQPAVQADLRALAASAGMSVDAYRRYFAGKQEADLLLESGGDPNARSVSDAIGVAQFMVGTGQRAGLKVDIVASNRLSRSLAEIERQIEWLQSQPAAFTKPVPAALAKQLGLTPKPPVAPPVVPPPAVGSVLPPEGATAPLETPGTPLPSSPASLPAPAVSTGSASAAPLPAPPAITWNREEWLAYRSKQWRTLVQKRRTVDHRFDPARAITAQTRYLLRLTRRYGGVDWALQAYHGGEAGAARTLRLFSEGMHRGDLASRGASFHSLPYSALYQRVSPQATPAAFSYLFGRSDDHRYYWWKVLMAEQALDLYRKDAAEFERQWQALKPGYSSDVVYYPEVDELRFSDNAALRSAFAEGKLVPLPAAAANWGLRTANLASLEPTSAALFKGLRPEAMGALLRLASLYRAYGGGSPLTVVAMVQTQAYRTAWDTRYPPKPLPPSIPRDPDYHSTGLVFDLQSPGKEWDRKVLEFAIGRLHDSLRVAWRKENVAGSQRYHVTVNPRFREEMTDYYQRATR